MLKKHKVSNSKIRYLGYNLQRLILFTVPSSPIEQGKFPVNDKNFNRGLNLTNALLDMM